MRMFFVHVWEVYRCHQLYQTCQVWIETHDQFLVFSGYWVGRKSGTYWTEAAFEGQCCRIHLRVPTRMSLSHLPSYVFLMTVMLLAGVTPVRATVHHLHVRSWERRLFHYSAVIVLSLALKSRRTRLRKKRKTNSLLCRLFSWFHLYIYFNNYVLRYSFIYRFYHLWWKLRRMKTILNRKKEKIGWKEIVVSLCVFIICKSQSSLGWD